MSGSADPSCDQQPAAPQVVYVWFVGYLLNLLVYAVFLVFLTSFALIVLNPQSTTCTFVSSTQFTQI